MEQKEEQITIKGSVDIKVIDASGAVVDNIKGDNLVVTLGRQNIAKFLNNAAVNKHLTEIAFGTNAVGTSLADTAPLADEYSKAFAAASYPAANKVQFDWTLEQAENNGFVITEIGMLCADGTLFSRYAGFSVVKNNTIRLVGSWIFTF